MKALAIILCWFLAQRGRALLGGAVLAALAVLAGMALLGLSGWFITGAALAGVGAVGFDVFRPAAGIRFLALARTAARYGERLVTHDVTLGLLAALREALFRAHSLPGAARALLARPARLLFRLTAEVDALDSLYLRVLAPLLAALLTAGAAGLALGLLDARLGFGLVAALLLAGLGLPWAMLRAGRPAARRRAAALEALRARTVDLVAGQTEWLVAGRLGAQQAGVALAEQRLAQADTQLNRLETLGVLGFGVAGTAILAGAGLAAAGLASAGLLSPPQAALVLLVALAALEPFAPLRRGALELGRTLLAARRLAPMLRPAAVTETVPAPPAGLAVLVRGLGFHYPGAGPLFHGLNLSIARGERVAIIGPSGAGKSTLLALLAGEARASAGTVAALPVSLLGQRTELFQDSLRGNLLLAAPAASDDQLREALAQAGFAEVLRSLPAGLDTLLGEGGAGLSGGQQRRLALARLLLRPAPLWVLDEPTEGLDRAQADVMLAAIRAGASDVSILVFTHLRREADLADRMLVLRQGRLVAEWRRGEPGFDQMLAGLRQD